MPLGLILLRFGAKAATGLSQASIFGASLGGILVLDNSGFRFFGGDLSKLGKGSSCKGEIDWYIIKHLTNHIQVVTVIMMIHEVVSEQ